MSGRFHRTVGGLRPANHLRRYGRSSETPSTFGSQLLPHGPQINLRSLIVWCAFVLLAIVNGGLRETLLSPQLGEHAGHVISTIMLCASIFGFTWLAIGWIRPANSREALLIGAAWVSMTLAFEFLAGHYLLRSPWGKLLADYNLFRGRIWVLVLVSTALAPLLMARARDVFTLPA